MPNPGFPEKFPGIIEIRSVPVVQNQAIPDFPIENVNPGRGVNNSFKGRTGFGILRDC